MVGGGEPYQFFALVGSFFYRRPFRFYKCIWLQVFTNGSAGFVNWQQTHASWFDTGPPEPYLVSLYKNQRQHFPDYERALANNGFDPITKTYPAKIGEVLEIVWQNVGNNFTGTVETHPFHAHGDHYFDIGCGSGVYDMTQNEERLKARGYKVATRDTTNLYRVPPSTSAKQGEVFSWRAWRIRVTSPGVWMIHCHILQHMIMGMQTVWVFGKAEDLKPLTKRQADGYLQFGGSAYGNESFYPSVIHYWHD